MTAHSTIRTRFAPSPTGYMHIGGMRTALFNWLFARHHGGRFILRVDDTDRKRNVDEALQPILNAFRWLGLEWDEGPEVGGPFGPYFQSQRMDLYREAVDRLLAEGKAFKDFDPPELVRRDRESAEKLKQNYVNIRRSLDLTDAKLQQYEEEKRPYVVRFLIPREETVMIEDAIRGHVNWDCAIIPDPVVLRGNGMPLYNFATVVDDGQLQISHVIRAEEHLSNTPVQVLMHQALGNELPTFAHIPFVTAPGTNKKLSKRELPRYRKNPRFKRMFELADGRLPRIGQTGSDALNPVMVEFYEKIGYLPEAVLNALSRLGWSLDDKTENLSLQTVIDNFTLQRVVKASAGLDFDKLDSYQLHWMGQKSVEEKIDGCVPYLQKAGMISDGELDLEFLARLITTLGERLRIFSDIIEYDEYFVADDALEYDEKAFTKRLVNAPESVELLRKYHDVLAAVEPFTVEQTETSLKEFVESESVKLGNVIHALRVSVTGKPQGPGMFECLVQLGKESCLRRIDRALARV